ncbi:MAG TPA: YciI family protein [Tepidisphaeraceae bacterium]|jgi:uncharacterized protein YciI
MNGGLAATNRLLLMSIAIAGIIFGAHLLWAETRSPTSQQETFAILYQPGPKWIKGRSVFDQDLMEHGQYMSKLLDQGHLVMGGPFSDSSGGLAIITARNVDEAEGILKKDPGVTKGVFKATLRPWYVVFRKAGTP